jgi:hypothetical protein
MVRRHRRLLRDQFQPERLGVVFANKLARPTQATKHFVLNEPRHRVLRREIVPSPRAFLKR